MSLNSEIIVSDEESTCLEILRRTVTPQQVEELEAYMLSLPQLDAPVTNVFCEGCYVRGVTLPAGAFAIGHAHRNDCINIVQSGKVSVLIDGKIKLIQAPAVFVGKAMDRKVGFIHQESVWYTVHATSETDLDKLEDELILKSAAFLAHEARLLAVATPVIEDTFIPHGISDEVVEEDRADYFMAIAELGFTHERVQEISRNLGDQMVMPAEVFGRVALTHSQREGLGIFSKLNFQKGTAIVPARMDGKRTPAGRYTNHSANPNAIFTKLDGDHIALVAEKDIEAGDEITVDYRQARNEAIKE
jgi:hypothetical protein